ncbi:kanadaptin [Cimex lectularius]|uniref:FHA domain-containing protein n=1 Tax=Cimex lectularius TaxID=79782 RepID=A0A8I6RWU6_CIMLE|nr:kanadaptin [Cimex lectularius]
MDVDEPQVSDEPIKEQEAASNKISQKEHETTVETKESKEEFKKPSLQTLQILKGKHKALKPTEKPNAEITQGQTEPVKQPKPLPVIPYEVPPWKGLPVQRYYIEELKNGTIVRTIELNDKPFVSIGRVEGCNIDMAHPTVSRFHAILQYRGVPDGENEKGFYLYDLGSTHGTFLNKYRIKSKVYVRIRVGHILKFGASSRLFCFLGPDEDQEEESDLSLTELKAQREALIEERKKKEEEEKMREEQERKEQERLIEERGISWGMAEDADEETDLSENPYAVLTNEELYIDDPKKALRMWYEREGEELHYQTERAEKGMFVSKLILPIDDEEGKEITIETSARNKKESQVQCALEACRAIDKMGLLKPSKQERKRVQKRNWEDNDYYDSDEDSFLDRTGDLDKKRQKRMLKAGKIQDTVETYESLMEKHKATLTKIEKAENKLLELTSHSSAKNVISDDVDALDAYMMSLKHLQPKKLDIKIAKDELHLLKEEEVRLRKLVNIARPTNMPELVQPVIKPKPKEKTVVPPLAHHQPVKVNENKEENKNGKEPTEKKLPENKTEDGTKKVIGPTLPPNLTIVGDKIVEKVKKKPQKKKTEEHVITGEEYSNEIWQPPKGQTGDGRTFLNDKYGY